MENNIKNIIPDEIISNKIYYFRNKKVMLDRDLAELYDVTTGNFNKAVKRNIKRFPADFMFQLSREEFKNLIFHIGISSWGGIRKSPFVFTEQGVAMLSGVLKSDRAIMVNIQIMRIFCKMHNVLLEKLNTIPELEKIKLHLLKHDKDIAEVFRFLKNLNEKGIAHNKRDPIGYKLKK